jgi:hypothetical protein
VEVFPLNDIYMLLTVPFTLAAQTEKGDELWITDGTTNWYEDAERHTIRASASSNPLFSRNRYYILFFSVMTLSTWNRTLENRWDFFRDSHGKDVYPGSTGGTITQWRFALNGKLIFIGADPVNGT